MATKNRAEQEAKTKHIHGLYVKPGHGLYVVSGIGREDVNKNCNTKQVVFIQIKDLYLVLKAYSPVIKADLLGNL